MQARARAQAPGQAVQLTWRCDIRVVVVLVEKAV